MAKHYVYRMDNDKGSRPTFQNQKSLYLCGCKATTIEAWAERGSSIIGIGGKGTGKRDALIYALRSRASLTLANSGINFHATQRT